MTKAGNETEAVLAPGILGAGVVATDHAHHKHHERNRGPETGMENPVGSVDEEQQDQMPSIKSNSTALNDLPSYIKQQYRRLALVTNREQMDQLDPADDETLIVSCDWLLWQEALTEKRHAVHYELGILEWDQPCAGDRDLYIRANDWIYHNDRDVTQFHGVSLGKFFCTDVAMALINFHQFERSILSLIDRFNPKEINFFDFSSDLNVLGYDLRKQMVKNVTENHGLGFFDYSDPFSGGGKAMSDNPIALTEHGVAARAILFIYTTMVELLTNLRCFARKKDRRVFINCINNIVEPLVMNFPGGEVTPIFLARTVPKKFKALWQCFRKGVLLVTPKKVSLTQEDKSRLEVIQSDLERAFSTQADGPLAFARTFVRQRVLDSGRLAKAAADVRSAKRLLDHYKPRQIVVDGKRNPPVRTFMELAHARGIGIDYMWHSPLIPLKNRFDVLGGDPRTEAMITRCLSWGRINEAWLDSVDARQSRIRTGCPLSDRYANSKPVITPNGKNALILQYTPQVQDLRSLFSDIYSLFVDIVALLRSHGYSNIRFKLHPGPGRFKKNYFEKIAHHFGIQCQILKTEPFEECVAWADIVVGPVSTGAMYETLAGRKPYYAILVPPHSMDPAFYEDYPISVSLEELAQALKKPIAPDTARKLLSGIYGIDEYPSGSKRFWEVMENGLT